MVFLNIHYAHEIGKAEKFDTKLILYQNMSSASVTGRGNANKATNGSKTRWDDEEEADDKDNDEMVDRVLSVFNIANSLDMMFLTNNRMEYMDTDGIVWRLQFDSVDDQDTILHLYQRFQGKIKVIPDEREYYYSFGLCEADQRNLKKDNRDALVERRLGKLERIASQMARVFTTGGGGKGGRNDVQQDAASDFANSLF